MRIWAAAGLKNKDDFYRIKEGPNYNHGNTNRQLTTKLLAQELVPENIVKRSNYLPYTAARFAILVKLSVFTNIIRYTVLLVLFDFFATKRRAIDAMMTSKAFGSICFCQ
jgi:hypothetical protein